MKVPLILNLIYLREIGIEQDIITKELVAIIPVYIWPLELILSLCFDAKQTFDDDVVNFSPHVTAVDT